MTIQKIKCQATSGQKGAWTILDGSCLAPYFLIRISLRLCDCDEVNFTTKMWYHFTVYPAQF